MSAALGSDGSGPLPDRPSPRPGAAFFRKRLARVLVVGGLALLAVQFLPHLPQDQTIVVMAPQGARLTAVRLSYLDPEGDLLVGAHLEPASPMPSLSHLVQLPNGDVQLQVMATLAIAREKKTLLETRTLTLSGGTQTVVLQLP